MKIILIHGDDIKTSFDRFNQLIESTKMKGLEIVWFEKKGEELSFLEKVSSGNLFPSTLVYVIDDFSILGKKELLWLNDNSLKDESNFIIFKEGEADSKFIKSLPKSTEIEKYDPPKLIFKFLESFYPGNAKNCLTILKKMKSESPELIFALLARHVRDIYWAKKDPKSIPYPQWRINKLTAISKKYTEKKLVEAIDQLSKYDIMVKSSEISLETSLDLFVVTSLG